MISDCKMCVRDDLWEYKMSYGAYHPDLQIYDVVLHHIFFELMTL